MARDPNRIEPILKKIEELWKKYPDLRLTQLIMNSLGMNSDPYYVEDNDLAAALEEYDKEK